MTTELESRAQAIIQAGHAATLDEGITLAATENPELYADYLASLSNKQLVSAAHKAPRITESMFEVSAMALVTAGEAKTFDEACEILARDSPRSYANYLAGLK